jgi:methylated-DNA-[protein]-cysteine S-methyltransferase
MDIADFATPIGIAIISGDEKGVAVILIMQTGAISSIVPENLRKPTAQLNECFYGKRNDFDLKSTQKAPIFSKNFGRKCARFPLGKPCRISIYQKN